ncbi:glycosyltransferase family 61 protein [Lichenihabitans sp. Uapishka_5]|uniref:glycosyltransferase family 61 protein n=1 Tax=Lichenihabitans sp. Uapishka_5 TaxID=3037302 RepID=UPI0029E81412|nr:glycosyltransferase family 61 protein [Lichenihabitans sp. Uapishka_5]MDX7952122.1 glycosyltransferase family 61 protein [Lichenihabitans sp. Uapishka_5]
MQLSSIPNRFMAPSLQPVFDGQDFKPLLQTIDEGRSRLDLALNLHCIRDGFFSMEPGRDGIIFLPDGKPLRETALFGQPPLPDPATLRARAVPLDEDVVVVVDCAWRNYYHWLCLAVPKMLMSRRIAGFGARIAIPDYDSHHATGWPIAYGREVWRQSLAMTGLDAHALQLPPGLYRAPRIYTLWLDDPQPGLLPCCPDYDRLFDPVRAQLTPDPASPKRLHVARRSDARVDPAESAAIEAEAERLGFTRIHLEDHDFRAQAQLFCNAEVVLAAHGAGLSNMLFGPPTLQVLELNRFLDGEQHLRPWYYLLAAARGQGHHHLNGSRGEFARPLLRGALERVCTRGARPADGPWWRLPA